MVSNVVVRVATLLKARDKHLRHGKRCAFAELRSLNLFHSRFPVLSTTPKAEQLQFACTDHETRRAETHPRLDTSRVAAG